MLPDWYLKYMYTAVISIPKYMQLTNRGREAED